MTDVFRVVVLISGSGTNLRELIAALGAPAAPARIVGVFSNRRAAGLEHARRAGIPTAVVRPANYPDREQFDLAMLAAIEHHAPDLVLLAGYMRILSGRFVRHYDGRLLNIHPSLLPKYKGLDTHARVLAAGDAEHGATVHFVVQELDSGPALLQAVVPVLPVDTVESLSARVQLAEYRIYPAAVDWIARGRVRYRHGQLSLDGEALEQPVKFDYSRDLTIK